MPQMANAETKDSEAVCNPRFGLAELIGQDTPCQTHFQRSKLLPRMPCRHAQRDAQRDTVRTDGPTPERERGREREREITGVVVFVVHTVQGRLIKSGRLITSGRVVARVSRRKTGPGETVGTLNKILGGSIFAPNPPQFCCKCLFRSPGPPEAIDASRGEEGKQFVCYMKARPYSRICEYGRKHHAQQPKHQKRLFRCRKKKICGPSA